MRALRFRSKAMRTQNEEKETRRGRGLIPMSGRQIAGKDFVELGSQKEEEFEMIRAH